MLIRNRKKALCMLAFLAPFVSYAEESVKIDYYDMVLSQAADEKREILKNLNRMIILNRENIELAKKIERNPRVKSIIKEKGLEEDGISQAIISDQRKLIHAKTLIQSIVVRYDLGKDFQKQNGAEEAKLKSDKETALAQSAVLTFASIGAFAYASGGGLPAPVTSKLSRANFASKIIPKLKFRMLNPGQRPVRLGAGFGALYLGAASMFEMANYKIHKEAYESLRARRNLIPQANNDFDAAVILDKKVESVN